MVFSFKRLFRSSWGCDAILALNGFEEMIFVNVILEEVLDEMIFVLKTWWDHIEVLYVWIYSFLTWIGLQDCFGDVFTEWVLADGSFLVLDENWFYQSYLLISIKIPYAEK